jgi:two-component system, NarL family, response regulator NreC
MSIKVMIADDHAVFRSGLRALLENEKGFQVVAEAGDGNETVKKACREDIDVLILDINMPGMTGPMIAEEVLKQKPRLPIVILTMHDEEYYLQELFKIGVRGFVLKKSTGTDLLQAIHAAVRGDQYIDPSLTKCVLSSFIGSPGAKASGQSRKDLLTQREQQVCQLLAYGHTNSEIAEKLFISERTVESHRSNIYAKLGLNNRVELVRFAIDNGLMLRP